MRNGLVWSRFLILLGGILTMWRTPVAIGFSAVRRRYGLPPTSSSQLSADLFFKGDARSYLEFDAPHEHVQEWLRTPSASDLILLGSTNASKQPNGLWECQQPRIAFMGLDLQPYFVYDLQRKLTSTEVVVEVVDSKTNILNSNNRAAKLVKSFMERAKFSGKSIIQAMESTSQHKCRLEINLDLTLHVPLPPFVPIPPGLNAIGSTLVKRTGMSRTEKLLEDLKRSYLEWAGQETSSEL
jgi:Protein of unknown function (DUF1997)